MRVVAGELGGRRLISRLRRGGGDVRPTSERVREAVFSILGPLDGLSALDLFAGTGALGIEAISRGARSATLVDRDVGLAEANVSALGIEGRCAVIRGEVTSFLARDRDTYDLVFCDPPYKLAPRLGDQLDKLLRPRLRRDARVIVESSRGEPLELSLPLLSERRYGSSLIRVHEAERGG